MHRGPALGESVKYWVKPDIENRIKDGAIAARFDTTVVEIRASEVIVATHGGSHAESERGFDDGARQEASIAADSVLLLTGYHADAEFLRRSGVSVSGESLEPQYDPDTFETNVPGLFIAGGQLAGKRTGSVFIENGRFHGERIAQVLAARLDPGA